MRFGRFVDQFHADLARCRSQAELAGLLAASLRELEHAQGTIFGPLPASIPDRAGRRRVTSSSDAGR